jgi:hypothetical protein
VVVETTTGLAPGAVLERAKEFFSGRNPMAAAFVEKESAGHVALRGQGGEEIVIAAAAAGGSTRVRGSSLLFGQQVRRFLSTLPLAGSQGAA